MRGRLIILIGILVPAILVAAAVPNLQLRRPADYYLEAASGEVLNVSTVNQFGRNEQIDSDVEEDIWDGGGIWNEPSITQVYTISSTSPADTVGGVGARMLQVFGLDDGGDLTGETVVLNGTTPVTLSTQYRMIYRMAVVSAGSGGENSGIIQAVANTDATVTAQINAGNNHTLMAVYQIPEGKRGCITGYYASINRTAAAGSADIFIYTKAPGEVWQVKQSNGLVVGGTSTSNNRYVIPKCFEPLTLVKMSAVASSAGTDTSAGFDMVLRPQ